MKYLMLVATDPDHTAADAEAAPDVNDWFAQVTGQGAWVSGDRLRPVEDATTVRVRGGELLVTDGPFTESKEIIAGYWVWQVDSLEEALEWARRCPNDPESGLREILEIRPLFEADDFGEDYTPELREQDERLAEQLKAQNVED